MNSFDWLIFKQIANEFAVVRISILFFIKFYITKQILSTVISSFYIKKDKYNCVDYNVDFLAFCDEITLTLFLISFFEISFLFNLK